MADIKIRDVAEKSVKTLDRAKNLGEKIKDTSIRTKDKAEESVKPNENSSEEYAADRMEGAVTAVTYEAARHFDKHGRKSIETTRNNVEKLTKRLQKKRKTDCAKNATVKAPRAESPRSKSSTKSMPNKAAQQSTKAATRSANTATRSVKSTAKNTTKTAKYSVKTTQKSIRTAEKAGKVTIKTAKNTAKATKAAAKASAKAAKVTARATAKAVKAAAKATVAFVTAAAKTTVAAVKAIIAAVKGLVSAIIAGGCIAMVIIIIIALIALIVGSCFGIFFVNQDTGSEYSMQSVIAELDEEFHTQIENTISIHPHDVLELSDTVAAWEDVLSVYSVKTTTDPSNATEVASIDDGKKAIIREIFWLMNTITSRTESRVETEVYEATDSYGNVVSTQVTVTKVYLIITVTHKTADEMADHYGFSEEQREQLAELLSEENRGMWDTVLSGVNS